MQRLVKTHDRLVFEDLNVIGMLSNHRLAQAISDVGWSEFARIVVYKQTWRGGEVVFADRWFPSSKMCAACGAVRRNLRLVDRVFTCECGYFADRDHNAAVNLARWAESHVVPESSPDRRAGGRVTNARGQFVAERHTRCVVGAEPVEAGTGVRAATT
nr:RNA-guided endonuclease TnpB family protein [Mycolicibacterium rutilum]